MLFTFLFTKVSGIGLKTYISNVRQNNSLFYDLSHVNAD
jgi:hypothetical protein